MDSLPKGITPIRQIIDGAVTRGSCINVIGVVTDFRAPISTSREDWKCEMRLFDKSVEDDYTESVLFSIFRPRAKMPDVRCGFVVLVLGAKVQQYLSNPLSLLSTRATAIHVYTADDIPRPPFSAQPALKLPLDTANRKPNTPENEYVSTLFHTIDKERLPTVVEFQASKDQSLNVKKKFCLLKDAKDSQFIDTMVEVVREPYDLGDKMTIWVSDYTENPCFYRYPFKMPETGDDQHNAPDATQSASWNGPLGKRSMQVTCFEPHATAIRECKIRNGSWIHIRNMQIKFSRMGTDLEGYVREDRNSAGIKINVSPIDISADATSISPELKEVFQRKRDYSKEKKKQLKQIMAAAEVGKKRKALVEADGNECKPRNRKQKRAEKYKNTNEPNIEPTTEPVPDLNPLIKCESPQIAFSYLVDLYAKIPHHIIMGDSTITCELPFQNLKYRCNVRVVDFFPPRLEEFARPCSSDSNPELLHLSDNEEEAESDEEPSDDDGNTMSNFTSVRSWEWRFYLLLEDAAVPKGQQKTKAWVCIDNPEAQCLTGLDASNLRVEKKAAARLRERMALLWGDLEEHVQRREDKNAKVAADLKRGLPPDASDAEEASIKAVVKNRPFPCCIRQYGVKVPVQDERQTADAGEGYRWQRMYGLFGTKLQ